MRGSSITKHHYASLNLKTDIPAYKVGQRLNSGDSQRYTSGKIFGSHDLVCISRKATFGFNDNFQGGGLFVKLRRLNGVVKLTIELIV